MAAVVWRGLHGLNLARRCGPDWLIADDSASSGAGCFGSVSYEELCVGDRSLGAILGSDGGAGLQIAILDVVFLAAIGGLTGPRGGDGRTLVFFGADHGTHSKKQRSNTVEGRAS